MRVRVRVRVRVSSPSAPASSDEPMSLFALMFAGRVAVVAGGLSDDGISAAIWLQRLGASVVITCDKQQE